MIAFVSSLAASGPARGEAHRPSPPDAAPVAEAGSHHIVGLGEPVHLDGSGSSDESGWLAEYRWTRKLRRGPPVPLGSGETFTWEGAPAGIHVVELTVIDPDGLSDTDWVGVIVVPLVEPGCEIEPGFEVEEGGGHSGTYGRRAMVDVRLKTRPSHEVRVAVRSSDELQGVAHVDELRFTPGNWATFQRVAVEGTEPGSLRAVQDYRLVFGAAESEDEGYRGRVPEAVAMRGYTLEFVDPTPEESFLPGVRQTWIPEVRFNGTAGTLSYELIGGPPGVEIDPSDGRLWWTAPMEAMGTTVEVPLRVSDRHGTVADATLRVSVPEVRALRTEELPGNALRVTEAGRGLEEVRFVFADGVAGKRLYAVDERDVTALPPGERERRLTDIVYVPGEGDGSIGTEVWIPWNLLEPQERSSVSLRLMKRLDGPGFRGWLPSGVDQRFEDLGEEGTFQVLRFSTLAEPLYIAKTPSAASRSRASPCAGRSLRRW